MNRKILIAIVVAGLVGIAALVFFPIFSRENEQRIPEDLTAIDDEGWERLGKPEPDDWLDRFPEPGQSFEQYVKDVANVKNDKRRTIYLQPLGAPDNRYRNVLDRMREFAALFFHCEAKLLDPIPMFPNGWVEERQQFNAEMIRRQLADRIPDDAVALVGITDRDLFAKGLNFVFGLGSLSERTGVYSLRRLECADGVLFLRRSLKLMNHETGHLFSIEHCIYYKCTMNGANSLAESDRQPIHLCPVDLKKLQWNTRFDVAERYRLLRDFYARVGMSDEAAWIGDRLRPNSP